MTTWVPSPPVRSRTFWMPSSPRSATIWGARSGQVSRAGRVPLLGPAVVKRLGRQADARGSERADYLVVQSVTRYEDTVLAGELAQLAHGIAEGSHLHLGEATDLSHGDFAGSRAFGVIYP